jgi:hypothetical protein
MVQIAIAVTVGGVLAMSAGRSSGSSAAGRGWLKICQNSAPVVIHSPDDE